MPPPDRGSASVDDDRRLVARMAAGDESALGTFYDRWVGVVHALAVRIVGDPDEAEDVVEETFWQAWRRAGAYDEARGGVSTWLLIIARARALDRRRHLARRRTDPIENTEADLTSSTVDDPSVSAEHAE